MNLDLDWTTIETSKLRNKQDGSHFTCLNTRCHSTRSWP